MRSTDVVTDLHHAAIRPFGERATSGMNLGHTEISKSTSGVSGHSRVCVSTLAHFFCDRGRCWHAQTGVGTPGVGTPKQVLAQCWHTKTGVGTCSWHRQQWVGGWSGDGGWGGEGGILTHFLFLFRGGPHWRFLAEFQKILAGAKEGGGVCQHLCSIGVRTCQHLLREVLAHSVPTACQR